MKTSFSVFLLVFFLYGSLIAQSDDEYYKTKWRAADSLRAYGLTKSESREIVQEIFEKAKKDNNTVNLVRAVFYKVRMTDYFDDDLFVANLRDMVNLEAEAVFPSKQFLSSLIGDMYWYYYNKHRYKLLERTKLAYQDSEDIKTWDATMLVEKMIHYYSNSVSEPERLQRINIESFDELLNEYAYDREIPDGRRFRPTLYDFLAFRAVYFFSNKEAEVTHPAEQFLLNDSAYLSDAAGFSGIEISTKDTFSFRFYTIKTLQDIIRFHLNDSKPDALIDADIIRLKYAFNNSVNRNKEALYLKALEYLDKRFSDNPNSSMVKYNIAKVYYLRGNKQDTDYRDNDVAELKTAHRICQDAISSYPESEGAKYCGNLVSEIEKKSVGLKLEEYNIPDKPFRTLVTYRNLKKLYFRIIKTSYAELDRFNLGMIDFRKEDFTKRQIDSIKKRNPACEFTVNLPPDDDFRTHKTEVRIPPLPYGEYILLAGTDENFSYKGNAVAYSLVCVNSISYIKKENDNGEYEFYVIDRETGQPLEGAEATIFENESFYDKSQDKFINFKNFKADKNGYFKVKVNKSASFYLELKHKDRTLSTKGYSFGNCGSVWQDVFFQWSSYYNSIKSDTRTETFFFTDRSLYRPGQTVYFKGLVIKEEDGNYGVTSDKEVKVSLYDVNYKKISGLTFVTNDFGTFSGSFVLPASGLNGRMRIASNIGNGYADFSVEDYKRPKFEVVYNPLRGSYKIGHNVCVKGTAKSYSGANISGAQVKFNITRYARYSNWYYTWFSKYYLKPKDKPTVITNGTTVTDSKGEFEINFTAIPDETAGSDSKPYFEYDVNADVTDINGETHSKETSILVGSNSLLIKLDIGENINKKGKNVFRFITTNMNGEREPVNCSVVIHKLKSPDRVIRERLWHKPDRFTMTREEYYRDFPHDEYSDESDYTKWEKETTVFEKSVDTGADSLLDLSIMREWKQGKYFAEVSSKDNFGADVVEKVYFDLYSPDEKEMPYASFEKLIFDVRDYEPGDTAKLVFGTSLRNAKVLLEVRGIEGEILKEWLTIDSQKKIIEIPVRESSRGSLAFDFVFVNQGRLIAKRDFIDVPYTNKILDISFNTFRFKTHPGDKEEWEIKIKGKDGLKTDAEMLAAAYDASLDDLKKHEWSYNPPLKYYSYSNRSIWDWEGGRTPLSAILLSENWNKENAYKEIRYDKLNTFLSTRYMEIFGNDHMIPEIRVEAERKGIEVDQSGRLVTKEDNTVINIRGGRSSENIIIIEGAPTETKIDNSSKYELPVDELGNIKARKDFRETVFFKPDLRTDKDGTVTVRFEVPEALTKWKFMGFAHTKDLKAGMITGEFITQKELMVTPNVPRYLREDDKTVISAKIDNLSEKDLNGSAALILTDPESKKNIDAKFKNSENTKKFEVTKEGSTSVSWEIQVPYGFETVNYKIVAKADNISDGEEAELPVLTNRMLVTETMPMNIRGNAPKKFSMGRLVNSSSGSLTNYCLTLEFTSNPAWYAILSLPYLMEFPHECAEQMFSRVYANSIAAHILRSQPKIKAVFDKWKETGSNAITSELEKNEELKSILLQESPWVMGARSESERKLMVGYLFEMTRMSNELDRVMRKLKSMQKESGAWPWFEGCPESRYITQHICAGLGKLYKLGIRNYDDDRNMVHKAVIYLDDQLRKDLEYLEEKAKNGKINLEDKHIDYPQIHYLYMRSFFRNIAIEKQNKKAFEYYLGQEEKYWRDREIQTEGMIALSLNRFGDTATANQIVVSLKDKSTTSEELGMYWKKNIYGYFWYEAPIETQALMIEVFDEVAKDEKSVDDMRVWLLKNKQTNDWKTTKATVEAVYALLLKGDDWLSSDNFADILVGNNKVDMNDAEAGTGYVKTNWKWGEIKPEMGNVTVTRKSATGVSWGALYWQYFEDLDKITRQETDLKIEKQLFVVENTGTGEVLKLLNGRLKVGDKVRVRIVIRTDRDMEFVEMKDMRAAGFEPVNVLSSYKYRDGLGYYESTRDAATYFFFDYLRKGTYVFEYDLRANLKGDFSNGITSVQCMYAPEFASHSEGVRVKVE